jgi:steroid 5-alpha reductase family enzyme
VPFVNASARTLTVKSLYLIFIPQSLMAWFITLLLIPILSAPTWNVLAYAGLGLAAAGLIWEITADIQLTGFLKGPTSSQVLDTGLWSICRHPNYFGEWLFWLGLALTAFNLSGSFAFLIGLPMLLLTFLLLRFTGVVRTESDISGKRPEYRAYQQRVPAFFPDPSATMACACCLHISMVNTTWQANGLVGDIPNAWPRHLTTIPCRN